jgi:hypothetical protein
MAAHLAGLRDPGKARILSGVGCLDVNSKTLKHTPIVDSCEFSGTVLDEIGTERLAGFVTTVLTGLRRDQFLTWFIRFEVSAAPVRFQTYGMSLDTLEGALANRASSSQRLARSRGGVVHELNRRARATTKTPLNRSMLPDLRLGATDRSGEIPGAQVKSEVRGLKCSSLGPPQKRLMSLPAGVLWAGSPAT